MGRPRGRPPLPKVPGQPRVHRGRSPNIASNPYSWQKSFMEQNATYNYLKHYQEELIKQYSQSLSLTQLTQLSQYFTQTQFANALAQSQFSNQFLTSGQNPILSNANLLKQFMPSQLSEKSTSYGKKKSEVSITPNLTMESLKAFAALDPGSKSSGFTTKKVLPQTITSGSQATTITKVKSTVPSSMYNVNLPHALTNQQAPINLGNKAKTYPSKTETITHSVTSMSQVPVACKPKPVYTPGSFKGIYTAGTSYGAADITKLSKSGTAVTKTTASSQIFKVCKNVKFQNGCRHFEMYYWLHNCLVVQGTHDFQSPQQHPPKSHGQGCQHPHERPPQHLHNPRTPGFHSPHNHLLLRNAQPTQLG